MLTIHYLRFSFSKFKNSDTNSNNVFFSFFFQIPASWQNATNQYHIGLKNGYDLFPKALRERVGKEKRDKQWDPQHKQALSDAMRALEQYDKATEGRSQVWPWQCNNCMELFYGKLTSCWLFLLL